MKVAIIGGGNIGTLMAAELSSAGYEIAVYTSKPHLWSKEIEVYDAENTLLLKSHISMATDDLSTAVTGAEYVFVTVPAQLFGSTSEKLLPHLQKGTKLGIIPGSGGAEFAFLNLIEKGCILFGFQRVHCISRIKEYGKSVYSLGRKNELKLASIPKASADSICEEIEHMFGIKTSSLKNYLSVTLTPSNPILHTTRLYSMFKDYNADISYDKNTLFYEEWDDISSDMLLACDDELKILCDTIPVELDEVVSLRKHYESADSQKLTEKLKSIKAFRGILSPMKKCGDKFKPDFSSRYFVSDFSYGLKIIKDIAGLFSVETPNIDIVWKWYDSIQGKENPDHFVLKCSKEEFLKLYKI